ncbi:hypothetical protein Ahy_B09g094910 [Arachis hypogaea]|uniref:Uncharacterized protein n=1 Tax=Arachis hypogaea TaxID=3818 RepID=A0A444XCG9_ARAHY|nr:hypothetical protein Ahy_B09g094910 [Arachis hypogaea]
MAERLCQKRALKAFRLDPSKWGIEILLRLASVVDHRRTGRQPHPHHSGTLDALLGTLAPTCTHDPKPIKLHSEEEDEEPRKVGRRRRGRS